MILICVAASIVAFILLVWVLSKRRIVAPNVVHIVQQGKRTISYGSGKPAGNVYYKWPSWLPIIGITVRELPVSNFDLDLTEYDAYDKDRLPFKVDIKAFFSIADTNVAAAKVESFEELKVHLSGIVQGAVRSILAKSDLETIMSERSQYGQAFTSSVIENLMQWGVQCTKNIELMDVRDASGSRVIENIMAKKKSDIEKESRIVVAENNQKASQAEIEANQLVEVRQADAFQKVGEKKAESEKNVGIAQEKSKQEVQEEAKLTKTKEMAVFEVATVRKAEIEKKAVVVHAEADKDAAIVHAEAEKEATIVKSEGQRQSVIFISEGEKTSADNIASATKAKGFANAEVIQKTKTAEADGIRATTLATAEGEKAMQLASVTAQKELAAAIGENQGYQQYLITIRQVEAQQAIGVEQAKNIGHADIKIIANAGSIEEGLGGATKFFSSKLGQNIAATLEGFAQSDLGRAALDKVLSKDAKDKGK
jgi:flotillin